MLETFNHSAVGGVLYIKLVLQFYSALIVPEQLRLHIDMAGPNAAALGGPPGGPPGGPKGKKEMHEEQIVAAHLILASSVDPETQTLLKLKARRVTSIRDYRKEMFTVDYIISRPDWCRIPLKPLIQKQRQYRAKAVVLYVGAEEEFHGEKQCSGCAQPGDKARGPFSVCTSSASLFRGVCSNVWS